MEDILEQLFEELKEIKQQNKTLAEQNKALQQEIAELKANQAKMFKEMLDKSIKNELENIIKAQVDRLIGDLQRRQEIDTENLQKVADFLGDMGKRLIEHIKSSKESAEKNGLYLLEGNFTLFQFAIFFEGRLNKALNFSADTEY